MGQSERNVKFRFRGRIQSAKPNNWTTPKPAFVEHFIEPQQSYKNNSENEIPDISQQNEKLTHWKNTRHEKTWQFPRINHV